MFLCGSNMCHPFMFENYALNAAFREILEMPQIAKRAQPDKNASSHPSIPHPPRPICRQCRRPFWRPRADAFVRAWVSSRLRKRRRCWRRKVLRDLFERSRPCRADGRTAGKAAESEDPHNSEPFRERHVGVLQGLTFDESKAAVSQTTTTPSSTATSTTSSPKAKATGIYCDGRPPSYEVHPSHHTANA